MLDNLEPSIKTYLSELNQHFKDNKIKKRNGIEENFDLIKIYDATEKAFGKKKNCSHAIANVTYQISHQLFHFDGYTPNYVFNIEEIQDAVELILMKDCPEIAKKYIVYREQRRKAREDKKFDAEKVIKGYIGKKDWRVNENSNIDYSIGGLILHNSSAISSNYWLHEIYPKEIGDAHKNGDIHIHDLGYLTSYCAGWSLSQLIENGIQGVANKVSSSPAKHLSTLVQHMVNFLGTVQNEWAGAQAFSSVDTLLAPFVRYDRLQYDEVKQSLQQLIFGLNTPSRWGSQACFSNFTFDLVPPKDLKERPIVVGGKWWKRIGYDGEKWENCGENQLRIARELVTPYSEEFVAEKFYTYADFQKEMDTINKAFIELMYNGDSNQRPFSYPIPTYNITKEFNWDSEVATMLFKMTGRYGTPYFQNFINSDLNPEDVRSMCLTGDTLIKAKILKNKKFVKQDLTIREAVTYPLSEIKVLSAQGYKDLKRHVVIPFKGDLIKITLEDGKTLSMTPDHPHLVYSNKRCLKIVKADNLEAGMSMSCRSDRVSAFITYNKTRKGKTFSELYGERSIEIKNKLSFASKGRKSPMKGKSISDEHKQKISTACKGHWVSENCRAKSSERWLKNNPVRSQDYWDNPNSNIRKQFSTWERSFQAELIALGHNFVYQKLIDTMAVDFFIPSHNLIIELERKWDDGVCYNDFNNRKEKELSKRYLSLQNMGYNVLVFNPQKDTDYRAYINNTVKIAKVEKIFFDGEVYDFELKANDELLSSNTFYANDILTHNCCRLQLDKRELHKRGGGLFGASEFTGSMGVVTINLPRIGMLVREAWDADFMSHPDTFDEFIRDEFKKLLKEKMDIAKESLEIKKKTILRLSDMGMYPYTKKYLRHWNNHFLTIGLIGMNEAVMNLFVTKGSNPQDKHTINITDKRAREFALEILDFMRETVIKYQEESDNLYNLESTPAEGTSHRLAKIDKDMFGDKIITAGTKESPYYTNSTQLPVDYTSDVFEALDHQDEFQTKYTGGTVLHCFVGEEIPDPETVGKLVKSIASNYKLPYFTITPTYSICAEHGYLSGKQPICPNCGHPTEVYSRVVGYYRPVQGWNTGKKEEFKERKTYAIPEGTK